MDFFYCAIISLECKGVLFIGLVAMTEKKPLGCPHYFHVALKLNKPSKHSFSENIISLSTANETLEYK